MTSNRSNDELEVIQGVLDRVSSYQDGAPEGTVEKELRDGLSEVGVEVGDDDVARLVAAVEAQDGAVSATDVLGAPA